MEDMENKQQDLPMPTSDYIELRSYVLPASIKNIVSPQLEKAVDKLSLKLLSNLVEDNFT